MGARTKTRASLACLKDVGGARYVVAMRTRWCYSVCTACCCLGGVLRRLQGCRAAAGGGHGACPAWTRCVWSARVVRLASACGVRLGHRGAAGATAGGVERHDQAAAWQVHARRRDAEDEELFVGFDPELADKFNCGTRHGPDEGRLVQDAANPRILRAAFDACEFAPLMKQKPEAVKFMMEKVKPRWPSSSACPSST